MNIFKGNQESYIKQNFKEINLIKDKIELKEFDNCSFVDCNFSETTFYKCKFYECNFRNCNLSLIDLSHSSFYDTIFENSKVIGINWTKAHWTKVKLSSPLQFYKCSLNFSSFFGLYLREIVIEECIAEEIDLREADCELANFRQTDFLNSHFMKTNLKKADFTDAINYNIDVFSNFLKGAKFSFPEAMSLLNCLEIELQ
jgi:fluoroquinolone resistance protein